MVYGCSSLKTDFIEFLLYITNYWTVDELGYSGDDVARSLRISSRGVSDCRERGRKILDKQKIIGEYLA
jgi:hypothetical protein